MDFIHDAVVGRRLFRAFALVDDYTRECLAIEADWSLSGERVRRVLERLVDDRGLPETVSSGQRSVALIASVGGVDFGATNRA